MISLTKFLDFAIVEALTAFKRAIFEDPLLVLLNWSPLVLDPCNWDGVYCSIAGDHVVKMYGFDFDMHTVKPMMLGYATLPVKWKFNGIGL